MQPDALERADVIQSLGCVHDGQQLQRCINVKTAEPGLARLEQPSRRRIAPR